MDQLRFHRGRRLALLLGTGLVLLGGCGGEEDDSEREAFALPASVEKWRKLTEKHFKYQNVPWALHIIKCESGGNPKAYNSSSGASGLFQHLRVYWAARAKAAGFAGASPFNAEANIAASAHLLYAPGGGPQHWVCKYSPFKSPGYKPKYYKNGVPVTKPKPKPSPAPAPSPTPSPDSGAPLAPDSGPTLAPDSGLPPAPDGLLPPAGDGEPEPDAEVGNTLVEPEPGTRETVVPPLASEWPAGGTVNGGCRVGSGAGAGPAPLLGLLVLILLARRSRTDRR